MTKPTLHLICNAHLDPAWQWDWQSGAAETLSTFRTAADLCEEFPDFVFCHNESLLYEWVEEFEPALFARIRTLVAAGRDLLSWERPELAPGRGNALVTRSIDDHALWFDHEAPPDGARFKLLELHRRWPAEGVETGSGRPEWKLDGKAGDVHCLATSSDGISWSTQTPAGPSHTAGDYCSFFYNPFRQRWVFSIRTDYFEEGRMDRMRAYLESACFD
jgi:hypothetical protein